MASVLASVADAIAAELNATDFGIEFTAVRSYADWDENLGDLDTLHCDVTPFSVDVSRVSLSEADYKVTIGVLIRKRFATPDAGGKIKLTDIDPLVELLEKIIEHFMPSQESGQAGRLPTMQDAAWDDDSDIKASYSRKVLRGNSQFSGWIHLVYVVPKVPGA
jgi:hypothetical protein